MLLKEQEMMLKDSCDCITSLQSLIPTCMFVCKWQNVYVVQENMEATEL